jgi:hypothetical protein
MVHVAGAHASDDLACDILGAPDPRPEVLLVHVVVA